MNKQNPTVPIPQLMVAPNGASRTKSDHPAIPVTIAETVDTAKEAYAAGAGAIHAHVRDENQKHVLDAGLYKELIAELELQVPNMHIQITTEAVGIYTPDQQRQLVRETLPKSISVGMREMFLDNDSVEAKRFYQFLADENIKVQHILFSPEELSLFHTRVDKGLIPATGLELLFVLGRYTVGQNSTPELLDPFTNAMKTRDDIICEWAVCAFGKGETACLSAALQLGGKARVGFENSLWNSDGSVASSNAERVKIIKNMVQ